MSPRRLGDQGLLQGPRRLEGRVGDRDQEGLSQARARQPPRLQPGRHRGRGAVQGDLRGLLGALRRREAQGVRRAAGAVRLRRVPRPARQAAASTSTTSSARAVPAGGGFSDLFGGMFGGRARTRAARRGAVRTSRPRRQLSFEQAIEGMTVSLRLSSDAACPACSGTGARAGTMPRVCPTCRGLGHADLAARAASSR